MVELLLKTSLIIWDKTPKAYKFYLEALNKMLRDILYSKSTESLEKPFDRMIVALGNDFRQILPVVPKGCRSDIIDALITSSYLWPYFEVLSLDINMRLLTNNIHSSLFRSWLSLTSGCLVFVMGVLIVLAKMILFKYLLI